MADRVIHLSHEHHAKLKAHARAAGRSMTELVETWVDGLGEKIDPVPQMKQPLSTGKANIDDPYQRQPFWAEAGSQDAAINSLRRVPPALIDSDDDGDTATDSATERHGFVASVLKTAEANRSSVRVEGRAIESEPANGVIHD